MTIYRAVDLRQMRRVIGTTRDDLANALEVPTEWVGDIETRPIDQMPVTTLREFIEACGGKLLLVAQFEDKEMEIYLDGR